MRGRSIGWLLCAGLIAAGCASSSGSRHAAGNPDEYFMVWASQMNLAEIQAGEMASQRAVNGEVRRYGKEMVQAHREANQELERLAERNGVTLASRPDEAHVQFSEHLEKLEGEAFDREYIGSMVANHAKTLAMFEERARSARDPSGPRDVRASATPGSGIGRARWCPCWRSTSSRHAPSRRKSSAWSPPARPCASFLPERREGPGGRGRRSTPRAP